MDDREILIIGFDTPAYSPTACFDRWQPPGTRTRQHSAQALLTRAKGSALRMLLSLLT